MDLNDILDRFAQLEARLQRVEGEMDISAEDASDIDVEPGITTTADLVRQIGAHDLTFCSDRRLSISSRLIRVPSRRLCGVGGEHSRKNLIDGLLDALHWHRWSKLNGEGGLIYMLGQGPNSPAALQSIALLTASMQKRIDLSIQVDNAQASLELPDLNRGSERRLQQLSNRDAAKTPFLAKAIQEKVADSCFGWSRTLTDPGWSGRVDGLEIARLNETGRGMLKIGCVGKQGGESTARRRFRELVGSDEFPFGEENLSEAIAVIAKLTEDRRCGELSRVQLEHMLEARVLRGAVALKVNGRSLQPVQSQFPAIWSEGDDTKYIDVIMSLDHVPWVVELKVAEVGGRGQYFRHAVGQAVLYREFIRRATGLHPWFVQRNLDASKCRAAVAFPMNGPEDQRCEQVRSLASLFDVDVVILPDDWNDPKR